jgi:hypothetical protein
MSSEIKRRSNKTAKISKVSEEDDSKIKDKKLSEKKKGNKKDKLEDSSDPTKNDVTKDTRFLKSRIKKM